MLPLWPPLHISMGEWYIWQEDRLQDSRAPAEYVKHTGRFTSKGLKILIEEGVRMRPRTLLQEVERKIRVSGQRNWDRRPGWANEWKL